MDASVSKTSDVLMINELMINRRKKLGPKLPFRLTLCKKFDSCWPNVSFLALAMLTLASINLIPPGVN